MYQFKSRVRYSETGVDARLSLMGIMNYMQDCSTFQSEDCGVGLAYLEEKNRAWLLSSWQIQILRRPALGEEITVCTWPYEIKGIYGLRNFTLMDGTGEYLVKANSCWFLLDTEAGKPVRVTREDVDAYGDEEPKLSMDYAPRKIRLPEHMEEAGRLVIMKHQIDTNHHVNNAQYVDMAVEPCRRKPTAGRSRRSAPSIKRRRCWEIRRSSCGRPERTDTWYLSAAETEASLPMWN